MRDYREIKAWQKAHTLTLDLYRVTKAFPKEELFGLTSQIRRWAASIGANIAEGCGKQGNADLARYLQIAAGSPSELDYHLLLAHDLELLATETYEPLAGHLVEVRKMITGFINHLRKPAGGS